MKNEKMATILELRVLKLQQLYLSLSFRDGVAFSADKNQFHQNQYIPVFTNQTSNLWGIEEIRIVLGFEKWSHTESVPPSCPGD